MRNLKRIISSFLVLVLCLGIFPVSALADAPYDGNKAGTIIVTVKDATSNTEMAGASVMLEDITAGREHNHGTQTTTATGVVSWSGLSSGWYRVTETVVPEGYILNSEETVFYFDTEYQTTYQMEIRNRPMNALHIYRIDPATQEGLAGAGYVVYDSDGHAVDGGSGTTDENGCFVVPYLDAGDYTVQEVSAPNGYNLSATPQVIHMVETSDEPYVVIFTGSEKSTITIFNYDANDGSPIEGSRWRVSRAGGGTVNGNLFTNAAGLAVVTDLEPGTYLVEELAVATGYISQLKSATVAISDRTEHAVVSLSNIKPGSITVYVGDSVTGNDLAGCTFTLVDTNGHIIATAQSNASGYVTFEGVEDGNYIVTAQPVKGYEMDTTSTAVAMTNGGTRNISFTATPKGTLVVRAISETDNSIIAGCEFEVRKMNGELVGNTYTTDAAGSFEVTGLDTGYYTIKELRAPSGYVIESATKTVQVEAGTAETVTFTHRDKPFIVVQCYINGTTTPIPNSRVRLYKNGTAVRDGQTGSDGTYTFTNLDPGTYVVEYVSAPDGYTITTSTQTVEASTVTGALALLYADLHSSILIYKLDGDTKDLLPGASFIIRDDKGVLVDIVTTDSSGTAVTDVLDPGQYSIHEQFAPTGYVPTTNTQTIAVRNNETATASFTNIKESAIVVYAYDLDGNPLANVSYVLYDVITGQELSTQLTDSAGVAVFERLEPGNYMVSQAGVPDGYVLTRSTQARIVLEAGAPTYVRFAHTAKATIKMQTVDSVSGTAVTGAVYQITNQDGSFVANYTTDTNGEAESVSLEPGTYFVKQIVAPDGYLLNTTTQTVEVQRNRENLAKFFNKAISHIVIECVESGSNFGLTGATVTIEDEAGKEVARGTTTEGGIFTSDNLDPGKYTVKVIADPDGYTCIQKQRTIEVTTGNASTVKFEFTSNNHIIVNLTDYENPSLGLEGSTFRIEAVDGDFETDIVTDKAGHAESPALPNGQYMVHQTIQPDGYILDQSYQWATVDASGDTVLDFTNKKVSAVTIQALTENSHTGLAGATFEIWEQNGKLIKTVTTDASGVATLDTLESGSYLVKEVNVPEGYTARTLSQTVTITYGIPTTMNFYHTVKSALTVKKVDADDSTPLAEAGFRITKSNGDFVGDYETDTSGIITIATLPAGTYNIAETKAPQGYVLDTTSRSFEIRDEQAVSLTITNHKQSELTIRALMEGSSSPLAGAEFEIWENNTKLVRTVTTDATGIIGIDGLTPGTYTVKESHVPDGYTARTLTQTVVITYETPSTLNFYHTEQSILTINKKDAANGSALSGAQFRITKANGDFYGDYTTNDAGQFSIATMEAGEYILVETKAPNGYVENTTPLTFSIKDNQPVVLDITNNKMTDLTIRALVETSREPLSAAEFEVYDTTGVLLRTVTTDTTGAVVVEGLNPGTYTVKETKVPTGYTVRTQVQNITITNKTPTTLDFLHTAKSTLTVTKVDAETGAPLADAKFRISTPQGDIIGDYTTNESGIFTVERMAAGTYNIAEVIAPDGYVLDTTSRSFKIEDDRAVSLEMTNHKKVDLIINALTLVGRTGLADAQYQVCREDGTVIKTVTTPADGSVIISDLLPGTYLVKETVVPDGYTVQQSTQTITISIQTPVEIDFYHTTKSTLTITKVDAADGTPLADATFRITDAEGNRVGDYTTGSDGRIVIDSMKAGTYSITEVSAPEGYVLDTTAKSFVMEDNRPLEMELTNNKKVDLTIRALVETTHEPLAGAEYEIYASDGNLLRTVTTDTTGTVVVDDLNPGTYTVKETKVPAGYTVRTNIQNVTIASKTPITLDFMHTVKSTLTITKVDADDSTPLSGATFRITTAKGDLVGDYTTDDDGRIVVDSLEAGSYSITETIAPEGYVLDSTAKSFTIEDDRPLALEMTNHKKVDLIINALTLVGRTGLADAQYQVCREDGSVVKTVTTPADGSVIISDLLPGTYLVKETVEPNGYTVQQSTQTITIATQTPMEIDFFHTSKSTLTVTKIDAADGTPLTGATFRINTSEGDLVGDYTTDESGRFVIDRMEAGSYSITETKAPDGYVLDSTAKTFTIEDNRPLALEMTNNKKVDLVINALTLVGRTGLAGAQYQVCREDGSILKTVTTPADGSVIISDLLPGTYLVKETIVPDGYTVQQSTQTVTIAVQTPVEIDFLHTTKSTLTVTKIDAADGTPLTGATFRINTSKGDLVGDYTTDESGRFVIDSMEAGSYSITEIKAPDGYVLDSTAKTFTIEDNRPLALEMTNNKKVDLIINALTLVERTGLAGAQFEICREDGSVVQTVTTPANGSVTISDLLPGTYLVKETIVPDGYTVQQSVQAITIAVQTPVKIDFFHTTKSTLTITKIDAADSTPLSGATFRITDAEGNRVGDYTTGEDGRIVIDSMKAGTYNITETVAPEGYVLDTTSKSFTMEDNRPLEMELTNNKKVDLVINALTLVERTGLAGAQYQVCREDGTVVKTVTTPADGSVTVSDLLPGTYLVKETIVPDGYTVQQSTQTITIATQTPVEIDFFHTTKSTLTITKVDAADGTPLPGATFRISTTEGDLVGDYTTDESGRIIIDSMEAGTYSATEIAAPDGYVLDNTAKAFTIEDNRPLAIELTNNKKVDLIINALTLVERTGLAGAQYQVCREDGTVVKTVTTPADGSVTISDLLPGTYLVKETIVPEGYTVQQSTQTVTIAVQTPVEIDFFHTTKSTLTITKIDAEDGTPLSGATFRITDAEGNRVGDYTTGEDGRIVIDSMEAGTYNITETTAPEGYVLDTTSKSFTMEDNRPLELELTNNKKIDLTIRALTLGDLIGLEGARFDICREDGAVIKTVTTPADGEVIITDLNPGTYMVKETIEPDGYTVQQATQTITITYGTPAELNFYHTTKSTLTITKIDAEDGTPLPGATFRINTPEGDLVGDYTTDESGRIIIDSMEAGTYSVTEIAAPDGYVLDNTAKTFTIEDNRPLALELTNNKKVDLVINALTLVERTGLAGAQFEICREDGTVVKTVTTPADGTVIVPDLLPGTYLVKETMVPEGYTVQQATQTVTIAVETPVEIDFYHTTKSTLTITKIDAEDGTPLAGATFRIAKPEGDRVGDYTTDDSGRIIIDSMPAGTYSITEISAPEGYVLDTTAKSFTMEDNRPLELELTNNKQVDLIIRALTLGDLVGLEGARFDVCLEDGTVVKTVTTASDGTVTLPDMNPGKYIVKETIVPDGYTVQQAIQTVTITTKTPTTIDFYHTVKSTLTITKLDAETGEPLSGAKFRITTPEGDLVGDYITNNSGQIVIDSMQAGTYSITEMVAPDGYTLDTTARSFTIEDNRPANLEITNYQKADLTIRALTLTERTGLGGAQYEICLEDGTVVKTVTTAGDGTVVVADLTPGNYIVKETKVPDGYTVQQATQTITITHKTPITLDFYHTKQSTVTIVKTDAADGKPLAGAKFRITKPDGEVVGDYTTNASGRIEISSLPAGTYNIAETAAPDGYILDTTSKSFEVKDDKATLLELTNNAVSTLRIVDTCKQDGTPIQGITFRIESYTGELIGTYTTNEAGIINVNLAPGTYTIFQTVVPDGYVKRTDVWNITIGEGKNELLEVQNERLTKIIVHIIDAETKAGIYGASINIKDINNNPVGSFRTDDSGNIYLTDVLDAGKYIISLGEIPHNYDKDEIPKTIEVEIGKTTEITWALHGHKGQVSIVTYAGEDNATMNIRKNTVIGGAIYQITTPTGQTVGSIQGDLNGVAYSGALGIGTYYFQQVVAPPGWQVNSTKFAVNVTNTNDNIRVEVYNKAANYATTISVSGTPSAMPGGNVKYNFNVANESTSAMANFFVHLKVPTDGMRAVTLYTGTYSGSATTYYVEYKTNTNGYRILAQNLNSKSSYSYGLSTQALGLQTGEYVTDIRMVFTSVVAGMKTATPATLNCYVLSTVPNGYQGIMRAECGAMNGYYSNASNGGQWGNSTGQAIASNPAVTMDNGWVTSSGQYITYVSAPTYVQNPVPSTLPTTGY